MRSGPLDDDERRELEEALRLVLENLATLTAEQNRIAGLVIRITEGLDEIAARSDRIVAILDDLDRGRDARRDGPCPPSTRTQPDPSRGPPPGPPQPGRDPSDRDRRTDRV
jgi:hypothetical protein